VFIDKITARENLFWKDIEIVQKEGCPLYIWGNARGGSYVKKKLDLAGVKYDGVIVNRKYYDGSSQVFCLEDILEKTETPIALIKAFNGSYDSILSLYGDKILTIVDRDCYEGNSYTVLDDMSYEWVVENKNKLEEVYKLLTDDKSRDLFCDFINQKISLDWNYLRGYHEEHQYFSPELIRFSDEEVFVDCGAFLGETAESFVKEINGKGIYSGYKIFSFEPDIKNYEEMINHEIDGQICIPKGCSDKKGFLTFSDDAAGSVISDEGECVIETTTIDEALAGEKATLIKMDIEGAELSALKGAKRQIVENRPSLAISIYHKKEDLWEITQYINSLVKEYKLYLRLYAYSATDLVLYAIKD
jgi:FkbM family methyltransferase